MNKKINLIIILAILIIPIILYYGLKTVSDKNSAGMGQIPASMPVVLDFSSNLCLECSELDKIMDPLKAKYKNKVIFRKIQINSNNPQDQLLIKKYSVKVVPTLVFMNKDKKVIKIIQGIAPKTKLEKYLDKISNG